MFIQSVFAALQSHPTGMPVSLPPEQGGTPLGPPTQPCKSYPVANMEEATSFPQTVQTALLGDPPRKSSKTMLCCFACGFEPVAVWLSSGAQLPKYCHAIMLPFSTETLKLDS